MRKKLAELVARYAHAEFLPPFSTEELAAVEEKLGVELPEEYRAFLVEVSRGEEDTGSAFLLPPEDGLLCLTPDATPSAPFPFGDDAVEVLRRRIAKKKRGDDEPAVDGPWNGALPLMGRGDGEFDCLVLHGPERGRMWKYWDAGWAPICVVKKGVAEPVPFLDWVEEHIKELVGSAPPPIKPDAKEIRLVGLGLTSVPPAVFEAVGAEKLVLPTNQLAVLPPELTKLTSLRVLSLADNALRELPGWIGDFRALEELYLSGNPLGSLPETIGRLGSLQRLTLAKTGLRSLPETLDGLQRLAELDLRWNAIEVLPESVEALPALRVLKLLGNPLRRLPSWIARTAVEELELEKLPELDLAKALAALSDLPALRTLGIYPPHQELPPSLAGLRQVKWLKLIGLGLRGVPREVLAMQELETLSLDQNQLTAIPDEVFQMPKLTSLVLFSNPISRDEVARLRERWQHVTIEYL
ncbi:leucine-rich repeat domain-containing protein [Sorangium sp. So ce315]|uniref:leucine-rich repeat domain-containing protein n=1 Tax=Sorangium sp. So ce315 TaxID=3133299 RepID=UPI003F6339BE